MAVNPTHTTCYLKSLLGKQVFRVKKLNWMPMGHPKLELLASNSAHIGHAI